MSWGLVFAVCVLSAACLREPKFNGDTPRDGDADAAPDAATTPIPDVTATMTGGVAVIQGDHFRMQFASGGGHFPESLTIDGTEMLGDAMVCNSEHKLGLALFPSLVISDAAHPGTVAQAPPVVTLPGPTVAQVTVPFDHDITCDGTTRTISGQTTFTAFPDGRITRHDLLGVSGLLTSTLCPTCTSGAPVDENFFLTTFATLRADGGDAVTNHDVSMLATDSEDNPNGYTFCVKNADRQLALAFFSDGNEMPGTRIRAVDASPRTLAFVHDVVRGADDIDENDSRNLSTTMLLGSNSSCDVAATRAEVFRARPRIELMPSGVQLPLGLSGIYASSTHGPLGIAPGPISFQALSNIPAGFAFWFELGQQSQDVQITHSNPMMMTPNWNRTQYRDSDKSLIVYFRNALAAGDIITITPP